MIEEFKKAVESGTTFYAKGALLNTPGWSEFIDLINTKYNNPSGYDWDPRLVSNPLKNGEKNTSDILIYGKFDPVVFRAIDYAYEYRNNEMDSAMPFSQYFKELFPTHQIKAIINLVGNESKYWVHKDDHDVVSWHCVGQVEWRIYHNLNPEDYDKLELEDKDFESYILNPGDLFYVPKGMAHQVVIEHPRASLILQSYTG
jgi:hypothetical protein